MKKADLSINVIIAAAIGIAVMIILILVFTGKIRILSSSVEGTCIQQGGTCEKDMPTTKSCGGDKPIRKLAQGCCDSDQATCEKLKQIGPCCIKDIT